MTTRKTTLKNRLKKKYYVRIYLSKGKYPVQLDKFYVHAKNKVEAKLLAKRRVKKNKTASYPLSWYMMDIN